MSRLAAPCRRNGFVILQAVHSLPVALHPALLRRSYLQLHVLRLHIGRTFTLLTRQHHRRTHPREREDPGGHAAFPISLGSACTQGSSSGSRTSWPTGSPLSRLSDSQIACLQSCAISDRFE